MKDKQDFINFIEQRITNTFTSSLDEIEIVITSLAAAIDDNDIERLKMKQQKLSEVLELVRRRILRVGNNEIRHMKEEIRKWDIQRKRYPTPMDRHEEVFHLS